MLGLTIDLRIQPLVVRVRHLRPAPVPRAFHLPGQCHPVAFAQVFHYVGILEPHDPHLRARLVPDYGFGQLHLPEPGRDLLDRKHGSDDRCLPAGHERVDLGGLIRLPPEGEREEQVADGADAEFCEACCVRRSDCLHCFDRRVEAPG